MYRYLVWNFVQVNKETAVAMANPKLLLMIYFTTDMTHNAGEAADTLSMYTQTFLMKQPN